MQTDLARPLCCAAALCMFTLASRSAYSEVASHGNAQTPAVMAGVDAPPPAKAAEPELEEVVVTAEKRSESVQSLPVAISVFSGSALENSHIDSLADLPLISPSLEVQDERAWNADQRVSIRGIGTDVGNFGGEPAVALSQDGVPYSLQTMFYTDFFDVQRVELLRGPQGTLSGRNSTSGALNIISNSPTPDLQGGLKETFGDYHLVETEGYLSGPIFGDLLEGRLAVRTAQRNGYVENTLLGQDLGAINKVEARGSLLARINDNFKASLIVEDVVDRSSYFVVDAGRAVPNQPSLAEIFGNPGFNRQTMTTEQGIPTNAEFQKLQTSLKLDWTLGASANLTATSGYVHIFNTQINDANAPIAATPFFYNPALPLVSPVLQLSQELTLTANLSDRLDMVLGVLYLHHHAPLDYDIGVPSIGFPTDTSFQGRLTQNLTSAAGYTQWRYHLTDAVRLTAGLRYTHDAKDYTDRSVFNGVPTPANAYGRWSASTPRFTLDYEPNKTLTAYATVSQGYKAGGFANSPGGPSAVNEFGPEHVRNYEVGSKVTSFDGRLSATLNVFYMSYTNLQQGIFGIAQTNINESVINVSRVPIKGVEWDLNALITDRFRLTSAGTLLQAKYQDLSSVDPFYPERGVVNLSGNQLMHAPKTQLTMTGEYRLPVTQGWQAFLRASLAWQSKVYFDIFNHPSQAQAGYGVGNLSANLKSDDGKWEVSSYVNNVTNKFYWTFMASQIVIVPETVGAPGLPRMYGGSIAYHF